jgi:hypothetical protein
MPKGGGMNKAKCYAASLGGCDSISGEHVMSKGLLGQRVIFTGGQLPMPRSTPIGVNSLVAKILCKKHNSALSKLDAEISRLGDACLAFAKASLQPVHITLDGALIERWLLKLFVGTGVSGWLPFKASSPPREIIEVLFGLKQLPPGVAMFAIAGIGRAVHPQRDISYGLFPGSSPNAGGMVVSINGILLLLSLFLDDPEREIRSRGLFIDCDLSAASLQRHPQEIVMRPEHGLTRLSINFAW